ncbi:MAG: hypothetical protein DMF85_20635 [Acidobacteria bacterium]|nr:MAG: hypothetical protein DMF85_20635 [Acidobacteriota bacterium]
MPAASISSRSAGSPACATTRRSARPTPRSRTRPDRSCSRTGRASSARFARNTAAPPTRKGTRRTRCCSSSCSRSARTAPMYFDVDSLGSEYRAAPLSRPGTRSRNQIEDIIMKRLLIGAVAALLVLTVGTSSANGALNVITATEDLASIAREVGGDKIKVESLARGYQDPHFVEAKPSFVLKLNHADVLIVIGRDLEIGWLPPLITQSRNAKIQPGADGYLDASLKAKILELPTGQITRAMGDVHPLGNPHYWLDPENGRRIAQEIRDKLSQLDGANAPTYTQREADFERRLTDAEKRWTAQMAPYKGLKVVTYHRSWPNFADAFGLDVIAYIEPKPGIPPTPQHTLDVINAMKAQNVKIIMVEPYFDLKTPNSIASQTGGKVLVMPPSVGGLPSASDYFELFDTDIGMLIAAIKETGAK